ncbi:phage major capsid protein [Trueperella pyogenes]
MTMTLTDLYAKRTTAWEKAKAFLDERRDADTGCLNAEDDQTYARMEAEIDAYTREIERTQRAENLEATLARAQRQPLTALPGMTTDENPGKTGTASGEYRRAFWDAMRLNHSPAEVRNALSVGTDSEGGYLVPDEFEHTLVDTLADQNIMRSLAKVITTTSGDRKIPVVATHGTAAWLDEGKPYTESDDTFSQVSLSAFKLGTFLKISEELLNDSAFDVEAYLASEFARRIGAAEEEAFINGDGSGKPTGLFNAAGGAPTVVTTGKPTDITADELIDLHYGLRAPYRKNAVWLMNDSTVKTVRKLKDTTGQYLWQPALTAGAPDTILGRPVHTSTFAPEVKAGSRTVAFGDLSYYWVADRQGRSFKRLNELFATTGQVGFLASQRVDGKLIVPEAVAVLAQKASN